LDRGGVAIPLPSEQLLDSEPLGENVGHASASAPVPVETQYYQNKPHQMLQNAKLATISTGSTKLESGNYSFAYFLADGGESKSTQVFYADIYGRDNTLRSLLLVPTNTHHAPPDTRYFLAYRVYFSFPW
jgi:hypothetical protein